MNRGGKPSRTVSSTTVTLTGMKPEKERYQESVRSVQCASITLLSTSVDSDWLPLSKAHSVGGVRATRSRCVRPRASLRRSGDDRLPVGRWEAFEEEAGGEAAPRTPP